MQLGDLVFRDGKLVVDLFEVALTAFPAYGDTSATLRVASHKDAAEHVKAKAESAMGARGLPV